MKAKTPDQLAKKGSSKNQFTLYLNVKNMAEIRLLANKAGIGASLIVDEAISFYLNDLKNKKNG